MCGVKQMKINTFFLSSYGAIVEWGTYWQMISLMWLLGIVYHVGVEAWQMMTSEGFLLHLVPAQQQLPLKRMWIGILFVQNRYFCLLLSFVCDWIIVLCVISHRVTDSSVRHQEQKKRKKFIVRYGSYRSFRSFTWLLISFCSNGIHQFLLASEV